MRKLVLPLLFAALLVFATPAMAGSNGQHIIVKGTRTWYVHICGHNQYWPRQDIGSTCTPMWPTPTPVTRINGGELYSPTRVQYWWKDTVVIDRFDQYGRPMGPVPCYVPKSQPWWTATGSTARWADP